MSQLSYVWIPFSFVFPNHLIIFFILRMEDLFRVGDRILRVENYGIRFWLISWKTFDDNNFGISWKMDSANEQSFTLLPSKPQSNTKRKTIQFPFVMKIHSWKTIQIWWIVAYNLDLCYEPHNIIGHYYIEELEFHWDNVSFSF